MSIIQISKILHRSGNLVDLPQLDVGEMGWANDSKRLFIGTAAPNPIENVEILSSYSNVNFSQINGSGGGNLNITNATNGQVLGFDGNNWVNKGGSAGGLVTLGDVSNVKITGGAIGYILETDGSGNLSWTSKGTLRVNIIALSSTSPVVMTVPNTTPYVNGLLVTISGVQGTNADTVVNGQSFYIQISPDFATSGNVSLYTNSGRTVPLDGTTMVATPNTGVAITSLTGSGTSVASGSNTSVQFNNMNLLDGSTDLTFDYVSKVLTVTGTSNVVGNLNVSNNATANKFTSTVASGTPPFVVNSSTVSANLNADLIDGYHASITNVPSTVVVRDANGNIYGNVGSFNSLAVSGNIVASGNVTALKFFGDGSGLTNMPTTISAYIMNGTSRVFVNNNSNVDVTVNNAVSAVFTNTGIKVTNITTGASSTPGSITGTWTLTAGSTMQATYADLAEKYAADQDYEPGTILDFGGTQEVTLSEPGSRRVAGVVSKAPAYLMNTDCAGDHVVAIALQGRTPCKVLGKISKGDMIVSAGGGYGRAEADPLPGQTIGKALSDFDGITGIIEVAVGR